MMVSRDRHNSGRNRDLSETGSVLRENVMLGLAPAPRPASEMEWPTWLTLSSAAQPFALRTDDHASRKKWGKMEPLAPL